jgi:hypothetical protein
MNSAPKLVDGKSLWGIAGLGVLVVLLWVFPRLWYRGSDPGQTYVWLKETNQIPGWKHKDIPVAEAAEKLLSADQLICGEYQRDSGTERVMVFSAKRFSEHANDIGLFVHTPDRCWTQAGWKHEATDPDHVEVDIRGVRMVFERRVFVAGGRAERELVYFGGLVGGQPLPYRLDHNLSVGQRHALGKARDRTGTTLRASDRLLWTRVWDAFVHRRALLGPKQFLRVSTSIGAGDPAAGDRLLVEMLGRWLSPVDYQAELNAWRNRKG